MTAGYPQRPFAVPADATELVLVRHGATAPAVPGQPFPLVDGHGDPPLAPEGEEQARRVAARLGDTALHGLYVTGLQRTAQTAAPLAARLGRTPRAVPALREVRLGDWEGGELRIRIADGDPLAVRVLTEERWDVIPGAEAMDAFAARLRAGVDEIVADAGPGTSVAVVVHGGVVGELCRQATDSRPFAFVHGDNGGITRLVVFGDGRWLLRSFNDTSHLG
jgi:probable phosphoglycerate mutase